MIIIDSPSRSVPCGPGASALFLDRDGVVNRDDGHVHRIEDFHFLDGIFSLCRAAKDIGYLVVVVTNQSAIARGYCSAEDFRRLSLWMMAQLAVEGGSITRTVGCPHHPDFPTAGMPRQCPCRKPAPGMILRAAQDLGIDLADSVLVGDQKTDVESGFLAGVGMRILLSSARAPAAVSFATHVLPCLGVVEATLRARAK